MAPLRHADAVRACSESVSALHACKQSVGLLPNQCYPPTSYSGQCDANEVALKQCMAYAADPEAAQVLYDPTPRSRDARNLANQKIQRKLARNHVPCHQ